jgi:hypothetical protein
MKCRYTFRVLPSSLNIEMHAQVPENTSSNVPFNIAKSEGNYVLIRQLCIGAARAAVDAPPDSAD